MSKKQNNKALEFLQELEGGIVEFDKVDAYKVIKSHKKEVEEVIDIFNNSYDIIGMLRKHEDDKFYIQTINNVEILVAFNKDVESYILRIYDYNKHELLLDIEK